MVTSTDITLRAADGHEFQVTKVMPLEVSGKAPKGAVIILHEIFGVTDHMKQLAADYAAAGYVAVVPHLFDRHAKGSVFDRPQFEVARDLAYQMDLEVVMQDIRAVVDDLKEAGYPVAVLGYCWGGSLAYAACAALPVDAGISYYGTRTLTLLDKTPRCPMLHHHGGHDVLVSMDDVAKIKAANPEGEFYVYPDAGHAFNNPAADSYNAEAAKLAWRRTQDFLERVFAG